MKPSSHSGKKKALFIYGFRLYRQGSEVKVRHFPYSLWENRYLSVLPELEVIGREALDSSNEADALPVSSGPGVTFTSAPDLSNLTTQITKRKQVRHLLRKKLEGAEFAIIRLPSEFGYLAAEEAERLQKPYVVEAVGCPFDALWNHGSFKGKLWAHIARTRMKKAIHRAPNVIYVTESFLQQRYPSKGASIACSNVTLESTASMPPRHVTEPLKKKAKVTFGLLGYLGTDYKGADTAIQALARLNRADVHLDLVGGGDSARLKHLAAKLGIVRQVRFVGQLPHEAINEWLQSLDTYLQPSRQEGLPRSLLEAMSQGLPAIGSTAGGIPELLPATDLHEPSDDLKLSKLLERALTDDGWRLASAERNLTTAKRYLFSVLNERRRAFLLNASRAY